MKRSLYLVDVNLDVPVYQQIKNFIKQEVTNKKLVTGDKLPSIHKLAKQFGLAPGTVVRAYRELCELGIISSKQGKGYYITSTDVSLHYRIFLLFDRISAFKEILYDSFRNQFDDNTDIQVFFHHYNSKRFEKLIRENQGRFTHYVLMPHLNEDIRRILKKIPEKQTIFIDNFSKELNTSSGAVYQDFFYDIYNALKGKLNRIQKYGAIHLSLSQSQFQFVPDGIKAGFTSFCTDNKLSHSIIDFITKDNLRKNELFIIFNDSELVLALKIIQKRNLKLGRDIGIISFDETPMKEILAGGISVLSTDFVKMGKTAADLVKGKADGQIANPFYLIERNSF